MDWQYRPYPPPVRAEGGHWFLKGIIGNATWEAKIHVGGQRWCSELWSKVWMEGREDALDRLYEGPPSDNYQWVREDIERRIRLLQAVGEPDEEKAHPEG